MDSANCVPQFEFLAITQQKGLQQSSEATNPDGILGLSPDTTSPLYLKSLKEAGLITDQLFGFFTGELDTNCTGSDCET